MKPPCKNCPFRAKFKGDADYLRPGRRAEIARSILEGADFPCHETVTYDDDEDGFAFPNESNADPCVGLDLVQLRDGRAGQMLRIRERLGLDTNRLLIRGRRIKLWTWDEVISDGDTDEEGETCAICAYGCEAPAGTMYPGGDIIEGDSFLYEDDICPSCGEYICPSCMFHPDHECIGPRVKQRRSPRPRKETSNAYDREAVRAPTQAQRSRPRRDRPGLPPDRPSLGSGD
jgi:hypothetical protein